MREKLKRQELEMKRQQVIQELPYRKEKLQTFKRTTLIMICNILGVADAARLGKADTIIAEIMRLQKEYFNL